MTAGGVMVTQNGVPMFQPGELSSTIVKFRKLFADGYCYIAAIPTYVGGHMAMADAVAGKFIPAPLTPEQVKELVQIPK